AQTIYRHMFVDNIDPENLPLGWRMGTIGELFTLQRGHDLPSQLRQNGVYPIYASTGINGFHNEYKVKAPCVVTGRSGSIGIVNYVNDDFWPLNTTLFVRDCANSSMEYAYFKLIELELDKLVAGFAAVPTLNRNDVHMIETVIAPKEHFVNFSNDVRSFFRSINIINREVSLLNRLCDTLLSKLSKL
ncbi:restriction endonuclease subunit S, partial [Paramuribaculum intestinale]